jgi:hypothetical protein
MLLSELGGGLQTNCTQSVSHILFIALHKLQIIKTYQLYSFQLGIFHKLKSAANPMPTPLFILPF